MLRPSMLGNGPASSHPSGWVWSADSPARFPGETLAGRGWSLNLRPVFQARNHLLPCWLVGHKCVQQGSSFGENITIGQFDFVFLAAR